MQRERMDVDVLVVGGGPAGLSAAIRIKQRYPAAEVCVLEKASEIGAHTLSGAVLEPRALAELFPDWKERGAPLHTEAKEDHFWLMTASRHWRLPTPATMRNHGNYIISLGNFCRWLAQQAEALGVQIFPGFPARSLVMEEGRVVGVITGDFGIGRDGQPKPSYQPGLEMRARYTVFAEGCRGSLARELEEAFALRQGKDCQTYGVGLKELWEIPEAQHQPGKIVHSVGWPMDSKTYGGSFIYHLDQRQLAIGYVIGLDYQNPHLNPFKEFQRFKMHPSVRSMLAGGRRLSYGARALNEGGWQSIPKLTFPGGMLVGCAAGFLNVAKIKGTHTAMKSAMLAADAIADALASSSDTAELTAYPAAVEQSWIADELKQVRNIRPAFRKGLWLGMAYAAIDHYLLRGRAPWSFRHHPDHVPLLPAASCKAPEYPAPDGVVSFDLLSSLYLSNTNHEEDQPCHLTLGNAELPIQHNLALFDAPEQRYCPAGVYEIIREDGKAPKLHINAQNCLHCKTCDIKDPTQNIRWVPPEGGGGPNYPNM